MKHTSVICVTLLLALLHLSPAVSMPLQSWEYAIVRAGDTPADAAGYSFTKTDRLGELYTLLPQQKGDVWLKSTFTFPAGTDRQNMVFLPGRISIADLAYCNGDLIGKGCAFPDADGTFFSGWNNFRYYPLPARALSEGENTLLLKIHVNREGGIHGEPRIVSREESDAEKLAEDIKTVWINCVLAIVLLCAFVYHTLIFLYRRAERDNLFYALVCLFLAIYLSNFFIEHLLPTLSGISYLAFQKLIFVTMYAIALNNFLFFRAFLRIPRSTPVTAMMIVSAGIPAVFVIFVRDYGYLISHIGLTLPFLVPSIAYSVFYLVRGVLRRSPNAVSLLAGTAPLWLCILYDMVAHIFLRIENSIYLTGFGFAFFLITMAMILARNFVMYHRQVENYSISLEQMVKERTRDLDERNRELEDAHIVMKKDLRIAANLQKSFFSTGETAVPGWQIAVFTRPASSVSGDFFDICAAENSTAVSLFDVSGHGIASGLITMIAKRTVFRMLKSHSRLKLGEIVEKINASLIEDIGTSGFYLTGVFLRMSPQGVEYVNAGHTEIMHRSGKSGAVKLVLAPAGEHKGNFLGIDGMTSPYRAISLRLSDGDFLVLYTDCIIESKNDKGMTFELDDLLAAASQGAAESAEDLLNTILSRFSSFLGGETGDRGASIPQLKDDLSVIVLRKGS